MTNDVAKTIGQTIDSMNPMGAIVIVAIVPWVALLLIWRGSEKLGIVGIGTTINDNLEHVVGLVEHAVGRPPSRKSERGSKADGALPKPRP